MDTISSSFVPTDTTVSPQDDASPISRVDFNDREVAPVAGQTHGFTPLMLSAEGGHKAIAERMIEKGADVNAGMEDDSTLLITAVQNGDEEIAKRLIEKGADVNARMEHRTPLMLAKQKGHEAVAELLIEKGAK